MLYGNRTSKLEIFPADVTVTNSQRIRQPRWQFCVERLKCSAWRAVYWFWVLRLHCGGPVAMDGSQKLTIIIPTYNSERMRHLSRQVRSLLKCTFVEKIIVTNNNPALAVGEHVRVRDPRLVLLDQPSRRGPGYAWMLAVREQADYFLSIDDDVLLFPGQVAKLFWKLLNDPAVPHGVAGQHGARYIQCREGEAETLYLLYLVTRTHAERYVELVTAIQESGLLPIEVVELWGDDIILSSTGAAKPRIHNTGFLLQSSTCYDSRVAIHKQPDFHSRREEITRALKAVCPHPGKFPEGSLRATGPQSAAGETGFRDGVPGQPPRRIG